MQGVRLGGRPASRPPWRRGARVPCLRVYTWAPQPTFWRESAAGALCWRLWGALPCVRLAGGLASTGPSREARATRPPRGLRVCPFVETVAAGDGVGKLGPPGGLSWLWTPVLRSYLRVAGPLPAEEPGRVRPGTHVEEEERDDKVKPGHLQGRFVRGASRPLVREEETRADSAPLTCRCLSGTWSEQPFQK
ncbi:uncharacterized protein [Tursiops truncatus]|uniref:uncharacterized protein isoform X2 n=1 Tax=Tursiops truncatus TaxID=9739 RepID=UPI003CCF5EE9